MLSKSEQDYFNVIVCCIIFISAVLIHSESVCGPAESVECDQVAIRRDKGDPGTDLKVTGQQGVGTTAAA
jgi:hypothetical protein